MNDVIEEAYSMECGARKDQIAEAAIVRFATSALRGTRRHACLSFRLAGSVVLEMNLVVVK